MNKELQARIESTLGHADVKKTHIVREGTDIVQVSCKVCGGTIAKLTPLDTAPIRRTVNGKTIETIRVRMAHTNDYREIRLVFKDNSSHITNCCRACCVDRKLTMADMEKIYAGDLLDWHNEPGGDKIADANRARTPVRYELEG